MKIRNGFITNSSSTSFILSLKEEYSKDSFLKAIGADSESPFNVYFEELFEAVNDSLEDIYLARDKRGKEISIEQFLEMEGYSKKTIEKVNSLLKENRKVFYGKLSTETDRTAELIFCIDSFIVCEDEIYFNGQIGGF